MFAAQKVLLSNVSTSLAKTTAILKAAEHRDTILVNGFNLEEAERNDKHLLATSFEKLLKDNFSLSINKTDFECFMLSKEKSGPILVKFSKEDILINVLQTNKTFFKENSKPASYNGANIFMNRFLPKPLATAYHKARQLKKDGKLNFAWIDIKTAGLLIQTKEGKTSRIYTTEDLDFI